jgi:hypothetical protein
MLDKRRLGLMSSNTGGGGITRALLLTSIIFIVAGFTMCVGSNAWDIGIGWGVFVLMLGVGFLCVYIAKFSPALPIWMAAPLVAGPILGVENPLFKPFKLKLDYKYMLEECKRRARGAIDKQWKTDIERIVRHTRINTDSFDNADNFEEEFNQLLSEKTQTKRDLTILIPQSLGNLLVDLISEYLWKENKEFIIKPQNDTRKMDITITENIIELDQTMTFDIRDTNDIEHLIGSGCVMIEIDVANGQVTSLSVAPL